MLEVGVVDVDLEQEPVEVRLGEREDTLLLERVLGRDHEEGVGQPVDAALDRDAPLGHRLEQRRLGARRGAVDLVREQDVREDRPLDELRLARARDVLADELGRRRVRRELDAVEVCAEHIRGRAAEQRLRGARRAFQQHVAAGHRRDQQQLDGAALSDDDLADLGLRALPECRQGLVLIRDWHAGRPPRIARLSPGR